MNINHRLAMLRSREASLSPVGNQFPKEVRSTHSIVSSVKSSLLACSVFDLCLNFHLLFSDMVPICLEGLKNHFQNY